MANYTLTLKIPLTARDEFSMSMLSRMIEHTLNERLYCNHPEFDSQLFEYSLVKLLKTAFKDSVGQAMVNEFGTEVVADADGSGSRSRSSIEADKLLSKLDRPRLSFGTRAKVTITKEESQ